MIDLYEHLTPRVRMLGDVSDFNPAAWDVFLKGQRDELQNSWNRAVVARTKLRKVREILGLPFIVDAPGEPGAPGAWNSDYEKNMLELQALVTIMTKVADEAVASKRALVFNPNTKDFGIELLSSDTLRVALNVQGRPVVVDVKTGQQVTEFEGTLGLPPLIVGGIVLVVAVAVYAVVEKICSTTENVARSKMVETVRTSGAKLIEEGKATPEQVAAMDKVLLEGTAAITKAEGEKAKEEGQWASTIRTIAYVGLGIAGIWLVGNLFGKGRMLENPSGPLDIKLRLERVRLDKGGYDSRGRYWGAEFVNGRRVTNPLYKYESDTGRINGYVRASDREDAKRQVRSKVSGATFYRAAS